MKLLQNVFTALTTENEMLINILIIPLSFVEAYISMLIFTALFNITPTKKQKSKFIVTISILAIITRIIIPNPYGTILNMLLYFCILILTLKITPAKALFCEFIPMFLMIICESIVFTFYDCIFDKSINDVLSIPLIRISSSVFIYLLLYLSYYLIKRFKLSFILLDSLNKKSKSLLLLTGLSGLILLGTQLYLIAFYFNNVPTLITLLSSFCLVGYFIISIDSIINVTKLETTSQNLEREKLYNKSLAVLHDSVRGFKHDFGNIVQAIGGYIDANDMNGLRTYYKNLKADCIHVNNVGLLNPDTINNPALYSLIAGKYYKATEAGIHFDIDIFFDFTNLEALVSTYELSRMLGILLDNAIEASEECEYKHMILKIFKDDKRNCIKFRILNTYKNKDINTDKIFQKGYSTKEGNSGLGLWEVHKYLSKHENLDLFTSKDKNYFSQELEVFFPLPTD